MILLLLNFIWKKVNNISNKKKKFIFYILIMKEQDDLLPEIMLKLNNSLLNISLVNLKYL